MTVDQVKIGGDGFNFLGTKKDRETIRDHFQENHHICFRQIFSDIMLKTISDQILKSKFERIKIEGNIGIEERPVNSLINEHIAFALWDSKFVEFVEYFAQCKQLRGVAGRIYKFQAASQDHFNWHNDLDNADSRAVGVSINFSPKVYSGGTFEIRNRRSRSKIHSFANTGFGDALFFKISPKLVHRVTRVRGDNQKLAFAGWFTINPSS